MAGPRAGSRFARVAWRGLEPHCAIEFPNVGTPTSSCPGRDRIGSVGDNEVVLRGDGIRPHHASVLVDNRGVILRGHAHDAWTHLNAAIVDLALVRGGDSARSTRAHRGKAGRRNALKPAGASTPDASRRSSVPVRGCAAGASGPQFRTARCRCSTPGDRSRATCDIVLDDDSALAPKHARIEIAPEGAYLRSVDGRTRSRSTGDAQGRDSAWRRPDHFSPGPFLLERAGLPARGKARPAAPPSASRCSHQTLRAITAADVAGATPPRGIARGQVVVRAAASPWLLILAGALIAACTCDDSARADPLARKRRIPRWVVPHVAVRHAATIRYGVRA